jgi:hypothetical protein
MEEDFKAISQSKTKSLMVEQVTMGMLSNQQSILKQQTEILNQN